ncbi:hypothetical protein [Balneatrix alpica]|uniref:Uncharacterized protein n=1 Tax=Balneatrix alpica TaxID=75684 RepID=A0ABV5ZFS0_9GAMM|nr:hypothetical protein [Balneatrix alpica]
MLRWGTRLCAILGVLAIASVYLIDYYSRPLLVEALTLEPGQQWQGQATPRYAGEHSLWIQLLSDPEAADDLQWQLRQGEQVVRENAYDLFDQTRWKEPGRLTYLASFNAEAAQEYQWQLHWRGAETWQARVMVAPFERYRLHNYVLLHLGRALLILAVVGWFVQVVIMRRPLFAPWRGTRS